MKKIKKIVSLLFFVLLFIGMPVFVRNVSAEPNISIKNLTNLTVSSDSIETLEGDDHVFIATISKDCTNFELNFDIDVGDTERYKVTQILPTLKDKWYDTQFMNIELSEPQDGSSCYHVTQKWKRVSKYIWHPKYTDMIRFIVRDTQNNNKEEEYTLIVDNYEEKESNSTPKSGDFHISSIELYNGEDDTPMYETDSSGAVLSYGLNVSSFQSHVKKLKLTEKDPSVVKLMFQQEKTQKEYVQANRGYNHRYISWGENYVIVNGGEPFRVDSSVLEKENGQYLSRKIPLKQGTNIIQILVKDQIIDYNKSRGLNLANVSSGSVYYAYCCGYTYIIENGNSEGQTGTPSSDITIKEADANAAAYGRLSAGTAALNEYTVGLRKGTEEEPHLLVLTTDFLNADRVASTDVILGLKLANAEAHWDMADSSLRFGEMFGNYACIRAKEILENYDKKFAVNILDDEGKVLGTQHFQIEMLSSDCDLKSLSVKAGGTLKEGQADAKTYLYHVEKGNADSVTLVAGVTDGAKLQVDGQLCENGEVVISNFQRPTCLTVIAEDGVTKQDYYIIYEENKQSLYFKPSEEAKELAKEYLKAWENRSERDKRNMVSKGYWGTFMAAATSTSSNGISVDGAVAKDVFRAIKENSDQATTYAAIILELVIQGENPYNYEGIDYVAKLRSYGPNGKFTGMGNNEIWALIAYRAAGETPEQVLIESVKSEAMSPNFNLDMRSWALAAVYDYMTEWEVFQAVENIRKAQVTSTDERALYTPKVEEIGMFMENSYRSVNMLTQGCALAGLANTGVDIISPFTVPLPGGGDTDPLRVMQNFRAEDGTFKFHLDFQNGSFDKDTMIGLGSVAYGNGKSVFSQYAMTDTQYSKLLEIAGGEALQKKLESADEAKKKAFEDAYTAANTTPSTTTIERGTFVTGSGKAYWDLYAAIADIDPTLVGKPNVRYCTMAQSDQVDEINAVIETIKGLDSNDKDAYIKNAKAISDAKTSYENLGKEDEENKTLPARLQSYVKDYAVLETAYALIEDELPAIEEVIAAIDALDDALKDKGAYLPIQTNVNEAYAKYDALTDAQKTAITNFDKLAEFKRNIENINTAIAKIKALPASGNVTLSDQAKVDEAQKAYDALTDALKKEVTNADILTKAQQRMTDLKAADAVTQKIAALGAVTATNWKVQEPAIAAARDSYNRLTDAQKAMVTNLAALVKAENDLASFKKEDSDKEAAAVIVEQIAAIGEITEDNWSQKESQIAAIRAAYDRLTPAQKELVTNLGLLDAAETAVKEQKAAAAGDDIPQINRMIAQLRSTGSTSGNETQDGPLALTEKNNNTPTWEIWTDEWIYHVADIRGRIGRLQPGLESLIVGIEDLQAAENHISRLQVERVTGMLAALPNADTVAEYQEESAGKTPLSAEQITAITQAKAAYDNLTDVQRTGIDAANLEALYAKALTYPDSRTLYLESYLQPYVDSLAYYYGRYHQGLDRDGLASVQEALRRCDAFTDEERAVLDGMIGRVAGEAVPFAELFDFLDNQAAQVQKDIDDAAEADRRIAELPDEITEENVNFVDSEIAAIEELLDQMSWTAKSYMKNQGRLGVLKALVDYYLGGEEVRQAFEAGIPELVSAEANADTSVQVTWRSYNGAASYLVLRKTTGGWKQIAEVTELAYTDTTAKQGTAYRYTVQARSKRWNGEALSGYNPEGLTVKTPLKKLTRPSWKKVQSAGYQSIKLSWHKVDGATGYEVYRSNTKKGGYRKIATLAKASYTDKGLATGKTYYYKVRAYHSAKKKTYGPFSAAAAAAPRLAKVNLTQAKGAKRAVQLKWEKVKGATGYKVYRASSKNGAFTEIQTLRKATSFKDRSVTAKKTYYYRVCAYRTVKGRTVTGSRSSVKGAAAR